MSSGSQSTPLSGAAEESRADAVETIVRLYGDMVFDLCESVLWSPANAQLAFRSILKDLRKRRPSNLYESHQRAWILRVAVDRLRVFAARNKPQISASEQIELDANPDPNDRLRRFDRYFHRLLLEEQILLLLKDKYGIPYPEIAAATGIPEGSLKVQRQQALLALEEWLWEVR